MTPLLALVVFAYAGVVAFLIAIAALIVTIYERNHGKSSQK